MALVKRVSNYPTRLPNYSAKDGGLTAKDGLPLTYKSSGNDAFVKTALPRAQLERFQLVCDHVGISQAEAIRLFIATWTDQLDDDQIEQLRAKAKANPKPMRGQKKT